MKKFIYLLLLALPLASCKDKIYNKYKAYVPVYMDKDAFRTSVAFMSPQAISKKGGIYIKDQYLFIIDVDKGIHIYDNSNPSSPVNLGFLSILGCTGMEIKESTLMANSFVDLVLIDIQNISAPVEINRIKDLFPKALPQCEKKYPNESVDPSKGVVIGWTVEDKVEETTDQSGSGIGKDYSLFANSNTTVTSASGISGSITKFAMIGSHLYIMNDHELLSIDVADVAAPLVSSPVTIWSDVETLFEHDQYLFMGTTTGMLIYSTSNPMQPDYISTISHARACDPVVVSGNYAYVTIRTGAMCGGSVNQLDVIDISNIADPQLKATYAMGNPHGLGIDGNNLFICDGLEGLKIFDASSPVDAGNHLVSQNKSIVAIDIIPVNQVAITMTEDGIYQYDYQDIHAIKLLSKIAF